MHRLAASASALLTLLVIASTTAHADIIDPGTTYVRHEIRVELGREFPDTSFVVFPTDADPPWVQRPQAERGVAVITSATPAVELGKFASEPRLWAIRGPLPAKREEITRAWLTERGAVCSEHVFTTVSTARESEGYDRIRTVFRIVDVTSAGVRLEGVSEERFAPDGAVKSRTVPHVTDEPPGPPGGEPDRRGGYLFERGATGLAVARLDPVETPALALAIAGAALGLLRLRRRSPALAA